MGKRRKRMMMKKYAKKYALQRKTLGFDKEEEMIEIDMTTGEEIKEEETVKVVSNKEEKVESESPPWNPEPELQIVQIEEPKVEEALPPVEAKKPTRKRAPRKKATATRKTSTRRSAKKAEE